MSQLTKGTFETTYQNAGGTFADNTTRQITEADIRQFADDIADSTLFLDDAFDNLQIIIDGGGSTITTGVKADLFVPYNCTVLGWDILGDAGSGSIVIDVLKSTYAAYPPTASIAGTEKPTLVTQTKNQDITLTSWTTSLTRNDILRFKVDSISSHTRVTLSIRIKRTAA
jgi:hypothetical protein